MGDNPLMPDWAYNILMALSKISSSIPWWGYVIIIVGSLAIGEARRKKRQG